MSLFACSVTVVALEFNKMVDIVAHKLFRNNDSSQYSVCMAVKNNLTLG